MSKKFRKLKAGKECVDITKQAISLLVAKRQPIRIFEMFGGNKLWRFDEAPEVDWAELFSLFYFAEWCRYIAEVYEPGVIFEFFSQDVSVARLNNVPRQETDRYSATFRQLLQHVQPHLPPQIVFSYRRHVELFSDPADYDHELDAAMADLLAQKNGQLPTLTPQMRLATQLNVKLKPGQADDPLWCEKVELQHQAIFQTKTLRQVCDQPDKIWTCPTYYPDSVVTGSTKSSYAKFWAGVGALKRNGDSFTPLVLTPKQLESIKYEWVDVDIPGLVGKNFRRVRVIT